MRNCCTGRCFNVVMHTHIHVYTVCTSFGGSEFICGLTILKLVQCTEVKKSNESFTNTAPTANIKVTLFCQVYIFLSLHQTESVLHMTLPGNSITNLFINDQKPHLSKNVQRPRGICDRINHQCFFERWHLKVLNNPELGLTLKGRAGINQLH